MAAICLHHLPNFLLLLLLLLLLFFFLHTHTHILVQADEKLIDQTCKDTEAPALCVDCIKSNPEGEKANTTADLASIIIKCISNDAVVLINNASDLAKYSSDKKFIAVCQNCGKGYSRATKNLAIATAKLKKGDNDNANHFVTYALNDEDVRSCEPNLRNYERNIVPEGFFTKLGFTENFLE